MREDHAPFLTLVEKVMQGEMAPLQSVGIIGDHNEVSFATDHIRRLLTEAGLEADYTVVKYATATPGEWCVRVTREKAG